MGHSYKSWTRVYYAIYMLSFMLDLQIAEIVLSKREEKPVFLRQKSSLCSIIILYYI
jgi:hypothetical protein